MLARSRRLLCLLLLALPLAAVQPFEVVNTITVATYREYLDNYLHTRLESNRGLAGADHDAERTAIFDELVRLGYQPALQPFTYKDETYYNVIARKAGASGAAGVYVVGAHYDSANTPGADDDASGVAALLTMARALAPHALANTVVFAFFDREEQGLIGSRAYVSALEVPVLGMVQLDMIGFEGAYHAAVVFAGATNTAWDLGLQTAITAYGGIRAFYGGVNDSSDHAPFRWAGFPAALVTEAGFYGNACYHKACDSVETPNYINYPLATSITQGVAGFLVAQADPVPVTVPEPEPW